MICRKCCNGKHHKCKAIKRGSPSWCDCQHRIDGDVQHRVDGDVRVDDPGSSIMYQLIMKAWAEAADRMMAKAMSDET